MLREIVQDKLDILLISERKVDPSFPSSQFAIESFSSPFRLDRNSSGGIVLFVREEIPSKLLSKYKPNSSVENLFETGLSDFHKLTFTVLKAYFQKQKPK